MRYLRIADKLTVYVQIQAAVNALEVDIMAIVFKFFGNIKCARVYADRIVRRNIGRVKRERIVYVCILVRIIAVHLPNRRHGNSRVARLIFFAYNIIGNIVRRIEILEKPVAREHCEPLGAFSCTAHRRSR